MMKRLIAKEWLELRRDGSFWMLLVILALLAVGAVLGAAEQARVQHEAWHAASAGERERWLQQEDKHPHSAAHYGLYAFHPAAPLAFFEPGLHPYLPVTVWLEAHRQNEALYRPAQDAGSAGRFGQLTPATIVTALLPLLVVLLAAPAIAGERERGTLRLLMAQGVAPGRWVLGKALALSVLLLLLLLPLWLLATAVLMFAAAETDALLRWLGTGVVVSLYLGGFLLICLLVSACCRTVRGALLILLGLWALGTLVAPRIVMEWAEWRHPTPTSLAFRQAIADDLGATAELDAMLAQRTAALLKEHEVERTSDLPVNLDGIRLQVGEEHGYAVFDEHFGRLHDGFLAQESLLQRFGLIAPYLAVTSATTALAGTDLLHYRHFFDSAEQYRRTIQALMNDYITRHPEQDGQRLSAGADLWATVPEFSYEGLRVSNALLSQASALTVLVLWFLVPGLGLLRVAPRLAP